MKSDHSKNPPDQLQDSKAPTTKGWNQFLFEKLRPASALVAGNNRSAGIGLYPGSLVKAQQ